MTASPTRKQRALATRRRILKAAHRLFCANGYVATTMDAIAAEADVAVQTLYFIFRTKGALLSETLGASIAGFDHWVGEPTGAFDARDAHKAALPWWPLFEAEPDARLALHTFVDRSAEALWRAGALIVSVQGAGDPDALAVFELAEQRRVLSFREVIRTLSRKKPGLRKGLSLVRATDILLVLYSGSMYHELHARRGWSHARSKGFLVEILTQQLLPT